MNFEAVNGADDLCFGVSFACLSDTLQLLKALFSSLVALLLTSDTVADLCQRFLKDVLCDCGQLIWLDSGMK